MQIELESGFVQIIDGQQFGNYVFDNDDYKVSVIAKRINLSCQNYNKNKDIFPSSQIRVSASDNPNTLVNGEPSNHAETKTLLLQVTLQKAANIRTFTQFTFNFRCTPITIHNSMRTHKLVTLLNS